MCKVFDKIINQTMSNIWDNAIYMTNHYLINYYEGTEHDSIKYYYAKYLWAELLNYLYEKSYEDKKKRKVKKFNINKKMIEIKILTHQQRINWYWKWLSRKSSEEKIVRVLQQLYPDYSSIKDVKRELGLIVSIEELKRKSHNEQRENKK